jgi:branched-chain amino acid aminotransferase
LLLEALESAGRPATEAVVPMARLGEVTEAFLVSTGRHVQPIRLLGAHRLADCPGLRTRVAAEVWRDAFADALDP